MKTITHTVNYEVNVFTGALLTITITSLVGVVLIIIVAWCLLKIR